LIYILFLGTLTVLVSYFISKDSNCTEEENKKSHTLSSFREKMGRTDKMVLSCGWGGRVTGEKWED
jgi:hypothetical protein